MMSLAHVSRVWSIRNKMLISLQPNSKGGLFFQIFNALELDNGQVAPPIGWGLKHALQACCTVVRHARHSAWQHCRRQEMHAVRAVVCARVTICDWLKGFLTKSHP